MDRDDTEQLGRLINRLEHALVMLTNKNVPAEMHVSALRMVLPDIVGELKEWEASRAG
jgi:hypothetical protein